jgi:GAF domain-containing protein
VSASPDEALARIREKAGGDAPRADRAAAVADEIRAHGGYRWVGLYDVTETEVAIIAWSGGGPPAHPRFPRTQGLTGRAVARAATVVVHDVRTASGYLEAFRDTRSEAIVPVLVSGAVVGTVDVESGELGAFGEADRHFLEQCRDEALPIWSRTS